MSEEQYPPTLAQAQPPHPIIELWPRYAEKASGPANIAAGLVQRNAIALPLDLVE